MRVTTAAGEATRRRLLGLTWAHLLNDGASNYLPGVLPAVLVAVGEPVQMAGVLIAALAIGQTLQPVVGWVADRVGGRWIMALGLLTTSTGGALLGATDSLGVVLFLLVLIGVGSSCFHTQALAGVRSMLEGRWGFFTAVFLVGGELGRGVWPTAASLVATNLGLGYLWIVGVPGLVTVALLFRWAPKLPRRSRTVRAVHWREQRRPLLLLLGYQSTRTLTTYGLAAYIPIVWHLRGGSLVTGASIITTLIVAGVLGNLYGGHLADRLGRRPVLAAAAVATAALVLPVAYLHGAVVWVLAGILGCTIYLTASPTVLMGQDIFPENRSMGSGIALGMANGIGALLVLPLGFVVNDRDVMTVFWVLAAMSLASVVPALAFPELPPDAVAHHDGATVSSDEQPFDAAAEL